MVRSLLRKLRGSPQQSFKIWPSSYILVILILNFLSYSVLFKPNSGKCFCLNTYQNCSSDSCINKVPRRCQCFPNEFPDHKKHNSWQTHGIKSHCSTVLPKSESWIFLGSYTTLQILVFSRSQMLSCNVPLKNVLIFWSTSAVVISYQHHQSDQIAEGDSQSHVFVI